MSYNYSYSPGKSQKRKGNRRKQSTGFQPWVFGAAALAIVAIAALYFWQEQAEVTGGRPSAACILVVDRTSSASNEVTIERYQFAVEQTIRGCSELNATTSIGYFDQGSPKLVYLASDEGSPEFALYTPESKRPQQQETIKNAAITDAIEASREVFASDDMAIRRSDIITALHTAANDLNALGARWSVDEKYLIILTDGMQLGEAITVEVLTADSPVTDLVDTTAMLGLVPSLDGSQVTFFGPRGGLDLTGAPLPEWFESKVAEYWSAVVSAGGGSVCTYGVDTVVFPGRC